MSVMNQHRFFKLKIRIKFCHYNCLKEKKESLILVNVDSHIFTLVSVWSEVAFFSCHANYCSVRSLQNVSPTLFTLQGLL